MCESFGARLRQRREEQAISLSTIADQTKIKLSLLEALERDDVTRWPSGIFRRAFVRAYAHAIGLQPDIVVREFLDTHPDPLEEVTPAAVAEALDQAQLRTAPPTRLRYLVGAAVGSLSRFRPGNGNGHRPEATAASEAPSTEVHAAFSPLLEPAAEGREFDSDVRELIGAREMAEPQMADDASEIFEARMTFAAADASETAEPVDTAATAAASDVEAAPEIAAEIRSDEAFPIDEFSGSAAPAPFAPDLAAAASLCTELSRLDDPHAVAPLLSDLARVLDAVGLIVWLWDPQSAALAPSLPYGYSDDVLAQLPNLPRDARNATAAAFRSAQPCVVSGGDEASDALVVPLVTPAGCTGVLAIELQNGAARLDSVRALATILAAQLARVVESTRPAMAANRRRA
jgi:transcriptional regulator with XRE-family HTH domain